MPKKVIYTASLQDYRPLIWYGTPVYERYSQLYGLLAEGLGAEYAEFIAEPLIHGNKASWLSGYIVQSTEFTKLNAERQEYFRGRLQAMLTRIKTFANELKADADPHRKELGELLEMAVEVPGLECVVTDNEKIALVAWGFSSEKSFRENFKLDNKISKPIVDEPAPVVDVPPVAATNASTTPPQQPITPPVATQPPPPQNTPATPPPPRMQTSSAGTTPPPPQPPTEKSRKGLPGWLWFLLGILVAAIAFFVWKGCSNDIDKPSDNPDNQGNVNVPDFQIPDNPYVVPPVDTTKIVIDPDDPGKRRILSDKVNVALAKGADVREFVNQLQTKYGNETSIVFCDTTIKLLQVQVPDGEWKQWIDSLKQFTNVKLAFPNTLFEQSLIGDIHDPDINNRERSWFLDAVEARKAWNVTTGDSSVVVAIADNGFDLNHKEFEGKIVKPYNVNTGNANVGLAGGEGKEHGTHVAGTAVANSNNLGICGIAPDCRLMPIQLGDANGEMQSLGIIAGILYAIHHDASVINLSLGTYFGELTQLEQQELISNYYKDEAEFWNDLFQFAIDENCVVVIAAGNENILAGIDAFARSTKILVVSAYQPINNRPKADFSNHGKYANISAPGVQIYSSVPGNRFDFLDGTSMASPIVTGAVALMKSKFPNLKAQEIITILKKTAKPLESSPEIGPLLQIAKALQYAAGDDELLQIPDDATDASFANGKWKSTSDLCSSERPNVAVEIYFDITGNGSGTVCYKESNGDQYTAPLTVTFENGKLTMVQEKEATGSNPQLFYDPCTFTCEQDGGSGSAECLASWGEEYDAVDFHMAKQ
ncbi:MAG: S8 family serine peptidase [Bacteroidales bacterium]|nr:S8 family serine peptidase [Bacteroidales bacterium]